MCDRFTFEDTKTVDTFCACCGSPCSDLIKCEGCDAMVCKGCIEEINVVHYEGIELENLCKACIFADQVESVIDSLCLIYPFTGKAFIDDGIELTFSPTGSDDDFKVIVKRLT